MSAQSRNPTPKQVLLLDAAGLKQHEKLMSDPQLYASLDIALLEYQRRLSNQRVDGNGAASNHFKITGAIEFLDVLKNLSQTNTPTPVRTPGELNQKV